GRNLPPAPRILLRGFRTHRRTGPRRVPPAPPAGRGPDPGRVLPALPRPGGTTATTGRPLRRLACLRQRGDPPGPRRRAVRLGRVAGGQPGGVRLRLPVGQASVARHRPGAVGRHAAAAHRAPPGRAPPRRPGSGVAGAAGRPVRLLPSPPGVPGPDRLSAPGRQRGPAAPRGGRLVAAPPPRPPRPPPRP